VSNLTRKLSRPKTALRGGLIYKVQRPIYKGAATGEWLFYRQGYVGYKQIPEGKVPIEVKKAMGINDKMFMRLAITRGDKIVYCGHADDQTW
jgi:hypothetical protein